MKSDAYFYLTVFVGFLIVVILAFIIFNGGQDFKYKAESKGVDFVSNEVQPADALETIRQSAEVIVSPQFVEQGPENEYMARSLTAFNSVLVAKGKRVNVVARVLGEKGELSYCQSNFGDPKKGDEISAGECAKILSGNSYPRILISFPDAKLQRPRIVFSNGEARLYPVSFENVSSVSFVFLESLYPDAEAIISGVNRVVKTL